MNPTVLVTNMNCSVEFLGRRCQGGHRHVQVVGRRAGFCARYPAKLCDAILDCLDLEIRAKGS
eukprot:3898509-Lingulodinium_polyedra.AAC.1